MTRLPASWARIRAGSSDARAAYAEALACSKTGMPRMATLPAGGPHRGTSRGPRISTRPTTSAGSPETAKPSPWLPVSQSSSA